MKRTILQIGLIIIGGLGTFSPSQLLACKYCDQAAAKASAAPAAAAAPAGTVVNSPGGFTPNGKQSPESSASTNQGGFGFIRAAAGGTANNLIPGYLDSVGRGNSPAQSGARDEGGAAFYVPNNAVYDEVSESIGTQIEAPEEINE